MRIIQTTTLAAALALAVTASPGFAMKTNPSEPTSSGSSGSSSGTSVPEPGMLGMMGLALGGIAFARRRQGKRSRG